MQIIFQKLEGHKDLKSELRHWCRQNGIKISFTVNMTITKSKAIFRKLQNTYKKGFGKVKTRWLQNQLKLFHFAVLSVSVLFQVKISEFTQQQWLMLEQAFPNKLQPILEYEAKNFTINKNTLKQKWDQNEDKLLTKIVQLKQEEPKWNQIAIQLYIQSNREFFRNGKQCRQRWLNHLDNSIKHEKWTAEEDFILLKGVQQNGKKWSRIMKCFDNQRTQHMIKNRFLSLILKCRKAHPFVQDQESALKTIFFQIGLNGQELKLCQEQLYSQRKLRPKIISGEQSQYKRENLQMSSKNSSQEEDENLSKKISAEQNSSKKNQNIIISQAVDHQLMNPMDCLKFTTFSGIPTPSPTYLTPMPFVNFNHMFPGYGYFQWGMNNFYNQIDANNLPSNHQ